MCLLNCEKTNNFLKELGLFKIAIGSLVLGFYEVGLALTEPEAQALYEQAQNNDLNALNKLHMAA